MFNKRVMRHEIGGYYFFLELLREVIPRKCTKNEIKPDRFWAVRLAYHRRDSNPYSPKAGRF